MENSQIRKMAKDLLPGGNAVKACLMAYWPMIILSFLLLLITPIAQIFDIYMATGGILTEEATQEMVKLISKSSGIRFLVQIIMLVLVWAETLFIYEYLRTKELKISNYFKHFKNLINVVVTYLLVMLYTFLWSLLFVIPGIIKSYSYRLAPYIMRDSEYKISYNEAITLSRNMMKGNKFRLFCLEFGYFFHFLLAGITFGIYLLWLLPRVSLSISIFYETVKSEYQIKNQPETVVDPNEFSYKPNI